MIFKALQAEKFVDRPDPAVNAILVYGANYGLGQEYISRTLRALGAEADEISASDCIDKPARLNDATRSTSLFGDKSAIWVREATDKFTDLCKELLENPDPERNFVIVEAGELGTKSRLRKLFEDTGHLAALPCYVERGADLERTISELLGAENITLTGEARHYLADRAPADRLALRADLERLALYAGKDARVDLTMARACLGDAADADAFDLPWMVFDGKVAETDTALTRLEGEGASGIMLLRLLLGHALKLHMVQSLIAGGQNANEAMKSIRPPLFYNQTGRFQQQLRRWTLPRLTQAVSRLHETELQCKSTGYPADLLVRQLALLLAAQP
ncbi:MAG: DNA polymerase III subunit delta [Bdellovibrionales bacterium]